MSFVLWHKIELAEVDAGGGGLLSAVASFVGLGLPMTVTNDIYGGGIVLDAAVTVTMGEGATADTFAITLTDLPDAMVAKLRSSYPSGGLRATIKLGYFDRPLSRTTVMTGRVKSVSSAPGPGGVSQTVIEGQEEGGYLLLHTPARLDRPAALPRLHMVKDLLAVAKVDLAPGSTIPGSIKDFTVCTGDTLSALRQLAQDADVPLVVRDKSVLIGAAVGATEAPVKADAGSNLVSRVDVQSEDDTPKPAKAAGKGAKPAKPKVHDRLEVTVLGHPALRAGQRITLAGVDDVPAGTLRIVRVIHEYGPEGGYTCTLSLVAAEAGKTARLAGGVQGVVDRLQDVIGKAGADHPSLDVGQVTAYKPGADGKHLADLHYGQSPEATVVAPSVASPVEEDVELHSKPVASAFAFAGVGLVTPVYPGMRALLAHNRGLVNDAVVAGWLWSEQPRYAPPPNLAGDWWLALPTEMGSDGLPTGKTVNDLTDAKGNRLIQTRGLHIQVGEPKLPALGKRPDPPTEDSVVIEHHTGTTIEITAKGELRITTKNTKLELTNGQVTLSFDGAKVAVK
jgi:phage protein D